MRHENLHYRRTGAGGSEETLRESVEVSSAEFNIPIDADAFQVTFAPGTNITDRNLGIVTKVGDAGFGPEGIDGIVEMLLPEKLEEQRGAKSASTTSVTRNDTNTQGLIAGGRVPGQAAGSGEEPEAGTTRVSLVVAAAMCALAICGGGALFARRNTKRER